MCLWSMAVEFYYKNQAKRILRIWKLKNHSEQIRKELQKLREQSVLPLIPNPRFVYTDSILLNTDEKYSIYNDFQNLQDSNSYFSEDYSLIQYSNHNRIDNNERTEISYSSSEPDSKQSIRLLFLFNLWKKKTKLRGLEYSFVLFSESNHKRSRFNKWKLRFAENSSISKAKRDSHAIIVSRQKVLFNASNTFLLLWRKIAILSELEFLWKNSLCTNSTQTIIFFNYHNLKIDRTANTRYRNTVSNSKKVILKLWVQRWKNLINLKKSKKLVYTNSQKLLIQRMSTCIKKYTDIEAAIKKKNDQNKVSNIISTWKDKYEKKLMLLQDSIEHYDLRLKTLVFKKILFQKKKKSDLSFLEHQYILQRGKLEQNLQKAILSKWDKHAKHFLELSLKHPKSLQLYNSRFEEGRKLGIFEKKMVIIKSKQILESWVDKHRRLEYLENFFKARISRSIVKSNIKEWNEKAEEKQTTKLVLAFGIFTAISYNNTIESRIQEFYIKRNNIIKKAFLKKLYGKYLTLAEKLKRTERVADEHVYHKNIKIKQKTLAKFKPYIKALEVPIQGIKSKRKTRSSSNSPRLTYPFKAPRYRNFNHIDAHGKQNQLSIRNSEAEVQRRGSNASSSSSVKTEIQPFCLLTKVQASSAYTNISAVGINKIKLNQDIRISSDISSFIKQAGNLNLQYSNEPDYLKVKQQDIEYGKILDEIREKTLTPPGETKPKNTVGLVFEKFNPKTSNENLTKLENPDHDEVYNAIHKHKKQSSDIKNNSFNSGLEHNKFKFNLNQKDSMIHKGNTSSDKKMFNSPVQPNNIDNTANTERNSAIFKFEKLKLTLPSSPLIPLFEKCQISSPNTGFKGNSLLFKKDIPIVQNKKSTNPPFTKFQEFINSNTYLKPKSSEKDKSEFPQISKIKIENKKDSRSEYAHNLNITTVKRLTNHKDDVITFSKHSNYDISRVLKISNSRLFPSKKSPVLFEGIEAKQLVASKIVSRKVSTVIINATKRVENSGHNLEIEPRIDFDSLGEIEGSTPENINDDKNVISKESSDKLNDSGPDIVCENNLDDKPESLAIELEDLCFESQKKTINSIIFAILGAWKKFSIDDLSIQIEKDEFIQKKADRMIMLRCLRFWQRKYLMKILFSNRLEINFGQNESSENESANGLVYKSDSESDSRHSAASSERIKEIPQISISESEILETAEYPEKSTINSLDPDTSFQSVLGINDLCERFATVSLGESQNKTDSVKRFLSNIQNHSSKSISENLGKKNSRFNENGLFGYQNPDKDAHISTKSLERIYNPSSQNDLGSKTMNKDKPRSTGLELQDLEEKVIELKVGFQQSSGETLSNEKSGNNKEIFEETSKSKQLEKNNQDVIHFYQVEGGKSHEDCSLSFIVESFKDSLLKNQSNLNGDGQEDNEEMTVLKEELHPITQKENDLQEIMQNTDQFEINMEEKR
ncbi:hypothetical protein BB560_003201 [Smittium megazygosporum]|uniref:Uncharacterized protein n=1 Tax=Smittium megazygosporum TaxID=133381 RepID=A0A2T9ZCM9_9FUNG|nr:hypothetical protein BB560_003201 [Smittium megazygosporum]